MYDENFNLQIKKLVFLFSALFRDRCINVPYSYLRGGLMA